VSEWELRELIGQVLREVGLIRRQLGHVSTSVAIAMENLRHQEQDLGELRDDHDTLAKAVAALQRWRWTVVGAAAAGAVVLSPVLQVMAR